MGGGFSSKNKSKQSNNKNSRVTEQDKAVLQLKQMRDKLKKYRNSIEIKLENEREIARQLVKSGKLDKAKLLLKKKKFYENNLNKTDQNLDNIEQLISTLEFTQIEHQVVDSLKTGNDCLKNLHEMLSIDEIEDIMDDTREAIEHQRKIDELLGNQFNDESMDEINKELEEIIQNSLPEVPKEKIPDVVAEKPEKTKEKESRKKDLVPQLAD